MVLKKSARTEERAGVSAPPAFRSARAYDHMMKEEALSALEKEGIVLDARLVQMMKLPPRLIRGANEKLEFYDALSVQPVPGSATDSPAYCFENKLRIPSWISSRYFSVSEGSLLFADPQRGIFVRGPLSEQRALAFKIQSVASGKL
ncbi:MAG: hypothetical protein U0R44_03460 [Candidatus Micrarchaeia archaeon]